MEDTDRLAKELAGILRSSGSRQTKAYDTPAVVRRVDGSTAWVHIPGGVDETPVQLTVAASAGDTVQVRVSGGTAWIVGNASAPPTDDKAARAAQETADVAVTEAEAASEMSSEARQVARAAAKIAGDTEQHFWFTETGGDTGAHITEKTQEDFLADPDNGGGNLLARSNGIAVRDGMVELAQFSADGVVMRTSGVDTFKIEPYGAASIREIVESIQMDDLSIGSINTSVIDLNYAPVSTVYVRIVLPGNSLIPAGPVQQTCSFTTNTIGSQSFTLRDVQFTVSYYPVGSTPSNRVSVRAFLPSSALYPEYGPKVSASYDVRFGAPSYDLGIRTGERGAFSIAAGENVFASQSNQTTLGRYNVEDTDGDYAEIIGNGTDDASRSNALTVDWSGLINAGTTAGIDTALSTLGWAASAKTADGLLKIQTTLEKLLDRLSLFDAQLVTGANWSSGTLTVPGSAKYRVFEVIQGGAAVVAFRYGNDLRGFALSGNATSGNYNQYVRAFGATANWSTEVWTLQWAKQLSHVTTSSYHTSGTEQAITEIRGLIPLQNA